MWRSLAARLLWEQEVEGSNPSIPTICHTKTKRSSSHTSESTTVVTVKRLTNVEHVTQKPFG